VAQDLTLVRAFCAIYRARSVSKAAPGLGVTQPTVSYSLAALREKYRDPLFVRSRGEMLPTSVADDLYAAFSRGLEIIDQAGATSASFDSRISTRRFRIAMSDIGEMIYLPPLLTALRTEGPEVAIDAPQVAVENTVRALSTGQLDFAIGYLPGMAEQTESVRIFTERYVCMFRVGHPMVGKTLSLETFQRCKHVMVSSPFSRHNVFVDVLADQYRGNIGAQVIHFTSVPAIVAQTDLIVTLPSRVARMFASTHRLRMLPTPLKTTSFEVRLHWSPRSEMDRGHQWMRVFMTRILSKL
jgi:DNA-binding transcriptional LysR family regulator